jgi:NAD(P)-dependent dehydrogenase (short-subunit alcohol dehydrogenase family)
MDLAGKVAMVTGAARRVGRAIALALGQAGADVVVHYNRSAEQAEATAADVRALGRQAAALRADLAQPEQIAALFQELARRFGRLDVLVNNAAVHERTPIQTLTAEQWDGHFAVNVRAAALCIRHAVPLMPGGGAVVNITDAGAEKSWPGFAAYCASKAALVALTRSAARALARQGIRVNAVAPGVAAWQEGIAPADRERVLAHVPLGRAGSPEDVAAAVVFLCRSDYVTGEDLHVDGGWHVA